MSESQRLRYVVSILVIVASLIGGFSTYRQYEAGLHEKKQLLYAQVRSLASLIEAVARFDRGTFKQQDKATAATLSQLFDAFADRVDFETAQEIQFVRNTERGTEIFLRYFGRNKNQNVIIPHENFLPEHVRRAASGESGTGFFVGLHGEGILAAYTYIEPLKIGMVVDVDLWGLQKPYLISGATSALFAAILLIVAAWAIIRLTNPIIARIREKELLNATIVETAHDALVILDSAGSIRLANPACNAMFLWSPKELQGRHVSVLLPPEAKANKKITEFMRSTEPGGLNLNEAEGLRRDGTTVPVRISASKQEYGEGEWCTLTIQDLSREKQAEFTIRDLSRRLLEIQDLEREEISRDLHDGLGSTLVGMKLQVQQLCQASDANADLKQQVLQNFNDVINQTRNISNLLSPFALRHLDIAQALRKLVTFYDARSEGRQGHVEKGEQMPWAAVNAEIDDGDYRFSETATMQIYRIAQEAIQNAVKHSQAKNIWVQFKKEAGAMCLVVRDDGRGFDANSVKQGQGMQILQERAAIIPGRLTVTSRPGNGTEVRLAID
ncbi:sensor histidine kinase [Turneriella parva]|uniref:histidine kinase n=1 Tax=Turneriella parva (strain ATCC BAA-1111 / DSM 21527 / NCTC 11395 / H) TaxID=869212 RepID=I4B5L3_TURPD|nr:PAS domain S-box protein [Turneriella parva]AFM12570.1 putative signal transduction histidine kinase [Turneriella parva DSM 21527]